MLKRVVLVVGAIAGIALLRKKAQQQQAEQELWTQATDDVRATDVHPAPAEPADIQDTPPAQS